MVCYLCRAVDGWAQKLGEACLPLAAKPAYNSNKHSCLLPGNVRWDRDVVQDGRRVKMGWQEREERERAQTREVQRER